jgi:hypothetical protein
MGKADGATRVLALAAGGLALLVSVGSVGPWLTAVLAPAGGVSVGGLEGDGRVTLGLGLVAVLLVAVVIAEPRALLWVPWVLALLFAVVVVVGLSNWDDLGLVPGVVGVGAGTVLAGQPIAVNLGWGLFVLVFSAMSGFVVSLVLGVRGAISRRAAAKAAGRPDRDRMLPGA